MFRCAFCLCVCFSGGACWPKSFLSSLLFFSLQFSCKCCAVNDWQTSSSSVFDLENLFLFFVCLPEFNAFHCCIDDDDDQWISIFFLSLRVSFQRLNWSKKQKDFPIDEKINKALVYILRSINVSSRNVDAFVSLLLHRFFLFHSIDENSCTKISIKCNHSFSALPIAHEVMFDFALLTIECGQFVVRSNVRCCRWRIETRKSMLIEKLLPKSCPKEKDADQAHS